MDNQIALALLKKIEETHTSAVKKINTLEASLSQADAQTAKVLKETAQGINSELETVRKALRDLDSVTQSRTDKVVAAIQASNAKLVSKVAETVTNMTVEVATPTIDVGALAEDIAKKANNMNVKRIKVGNIERDFSGNIISADYEVIR